MMRKTLIVNVAHPIQEGDGAHPASASVHADLHPPVRELGGPLFTGELAALIRVEDLRHTACASLRLMQGLQAQGPTGTSSSVERATPSRWHCVLMLSFGRGGSMSSAARFTLRAAWTFLPRSPASR